MLDMPFTLLVLVAGIAAVILLVLLVLALRRPAVPAAAENENMAQLVRTQAEMIGRLQAFNESIAGRQAELERAVNERLDGVSHKMSQSLHLQTQATVDNLQQLNARIAVIDSAQKNLGELTAQVTSLRDVLSNKQARGAFGQGRMEVIVRDGLPQGAYAFQFTLSNRTRPDCAVFLPDKRPLIIDAKFPLEGVTAFREAGSEDERNRAATRLRQDIGRHITDIAQKYLIPGETQEMALMFVPSESVYADLHDGFDDVVQKAYRARVILVSPSLLMLAIQVVQQIQRDARMREAADRIRTEVDAMSKDLRLLRERVNKLQTHFGQANEDVRQILISADKVDKRASRIEELDFNDDGVPDNTLALQPPLHGVLRMGE